METINDELGIIIQTSGIFIALLFVIASFRLQSLRKLMLGQGKTVLDKAQEGLQNLQINTAGYNLYYEHFPYDNSDLNKSGDKNKYKLYIDRLSGAIQFEEINGVEEILLRFTKAELNYCNHKNIEPGRTGFVKGVFPRFIKTKKYFKILKALTIISFAPFWILIIIALLLSNWGAGFFLLVKGLLLLGVIISGFLVMIFFSKPIGQEKYKSKQVAELRESDKEISDIYKNQMLFSRFNFR